MKYVTYIRVSTVRQGQSGLGLEAQTALLARYIDANPGEIVKEFREVQSGRKRSRVELKKAVEAAKDLGATLVVAKIDRLARDTEFLLKIVNSGIDVVFCDLPQISGPIGKFMLTVMAAIAELESGLISQRTCEAMDAAKARGTKLGDHAKELSEKAKAQSRALDLSSTISDIMDQGFTSHRDIARELNQQGIPTPNGKRWHPTSVGRILDRLAV